MIHNSKHSYLYMPGNLFVILAAIALVSCFMESAVASSGGPPTVIRPDVEVLDYHDLLAGVDLTASIERAYGEHGPGLLTVKNIPGLTEARWDYDKEI